MGGAAAKGALTPPLRGRMTTCRERGNRADKRPHPLDGLDGERRLGDCRRRLAAGIEIVVRGK